MENEELAALRASLLAAQRQPAPARARQARLSALVADGDELVPYVLARSCSDPRDRRVPDDLRRYRVLEGGVGGPPDGSQARIFPPRGSPRREAPPASAGWIVLALLLLALLWLTARLLVQVAVLRR